MLTSAFDFDLPPELVAQAPRARGTERLLVVHRRATVFREVVFADLPGLLAPGDLLVANDSRVFPARLLGRRDPSGGAVECLLLARERADDWRALVHPGQKLKSGARVVFEDAIRAPGVHLTGEILERRFFGQRLVRFTAAGASFDEAVDRLGHVPLPPYLDRSDDRTDRETYQTVFARVRGSIAAPTAGLHLTPAIIASLADRGIDWATVTLHVGYGTFKPVRTERIDDHQVDAESFSISASAAGAIDAARARGGRVVAVGTTTTRALESSGGDAGRVRSGPGDTSLFIRPGHHFRTVDALVTNFHLPRSSLLMLVAAFAGPELTLAAYRHAVAERFRFYSYGDAMLIL
jgi:S-adenosylmethionine:tRNA ribosyltransferase-isomerase